MALSKEEIGEIRHENQKAEPSREKSATKMSNKKIAFVSIVSVLLILAGIGIGVSFANSNKPGPVDDFAKCLTEKGAVVYGAPLCKYTAAQKAMFGNSMRLIDYRDFTQDPNVEITPTWLINGAYYQNVQTFDRLADLTGCKIG
ncbi:hypothetical protein HYW19_02680 [Candidatus Woesearchaeota archaeon]|nr:hypothetical protein [Candidatus Woesearchaeota archaeon]